MQTDRDTPTTTLIRRITRFGDADAANALLRVIRDHHLKRQTYRYIGRNRLVDEDDIESEFLLGCYKAFTSVDPDKGNPLLYILWKGNLAVLTIFRNKLKKGVAIRCLDCGHSGRMAFKHGKPKCKRCDSERVDTWQIVIPAEELVREDEKATGLSGAEMLALDELEIARDLSFNRATYGVQIEEMRARLAGRSLELFDILIGEGLNAESSQNYLREIAARWGVSAPSVCAALRRLRAEILAYYERA